MDYIKDKFNISNEAWHEIAMKATPNVPNKYCINKRIKQLNKYWNLKPTPGGAEGVQQGFEDSLKNQIERLRKNGTLKDNA